MTPAELAAKWRSYTGPEDVVELEADARAVRLAALQAAAQAVCRYCRDGWSISDTPGWWSHSHPESALHPPCEAHMIHRLIEKEAANDPR